MLSSPTRNRKSLTVCTSPPPLLLLPPADRPGAAAVAVPGRAPCPGCLPALPAAPPALAVLTAAAAAAALARASAMRIRVWMLRQLAGASWEWKRER